MHLSSLKRPSGAQTVAVSKPRNHRAVALAGGLISALVWQAPASAEESLAHRVDAVIDRWVSQEKIVGVVAMIARDGKIVYRRAAGWADRENRVPVRQDTIFRLASMTKMLTSATALKLIEEGRLSLDDTVTRWLPYFTPRLEDGRQPDITVRQLMTHTSGLSYAFLEPEGNAYDREHVPYGLEAAGPTLDEAMRKIASVPLVYEPGMQWRYSVSTDVLGAVIEKAAGMTLSGAIAHYVTGPLHMTGTAFTVTETERLAAGYRDGETTAIRLNDDTDLIPLSATMPVSLNRNLDPAAYPSGGGGMSGTAGDYIRFLEAVRTGGAPIMSADSAAALATNAIGGLRAWTEGEGWGFSLGAAVVVDPEAARTPQHAGTYAWGGVFGSHWFVDPVDRLTVVVLTNTSLAGVMGEFPVEIRNAVYGVEEM